MTTIIDGKALAKKINAQTKELVAQLKEKQNIIPGIAVVIAGDDAASLIYTRNKHNKAIKLGINSVLKKFPADVSQDELLAEIEKLNNDDTIDAILVQQPLPQLDPEVITNAILPAKDVDGLNPLNLGKLFANQHGNYPVACTPRGIMRMLAEYNIDLQGKNAVIVGRSILVGKPLLALLNNANATVTMAGRSTSDLSALTKTADILIVATGVPNLIKATDVKSGAVVIDVGINRLSDGKLTGDVDFAAVRAKAQAITPVPGGVGPMTIATLMEQTVDLAQWRHHG